MGTVTSVGSKHLQSGIKSFSEIDFSKVSAIENTAPAVTKSVEESANSAKTRGKMLSVQDSTIQSVIKGLGKIDLKANRIMDINTMMSAFDDYLEEVKKGDSGTPIGFHLKNISKQELAKLWIDKYYPNRDMPLDQNLNSNPIKNQN